MQRRGRIVGGCIAWMAVLGFIGCGKSPRSCAPPELSRSSQYLDLNAPQQNKVIEKDLLHDALVRFSKDANQTPTTRPQRILALSGGGSHGAYSAGVLCGWTASGTRPTFDVVTGVSTGSLISTYAFLGPQYDHKLRELYTTVKDGDIYRERPRLALLWSDSAASAAPLRKMIETQIDAPLLQAVATAHCQGRRLYVGTTNLDAKQLVIWDMGAIASSGRPESLELFRTVVLASSSVPGFFPPVPIDVEVNGHRYTEKHADGSTTSQVFLRGSLLNFDREVVKEGKRPLVGSAVYLIVAGKLYADPSCTKSSVAGVAGNALDSLLASELRNDLARIWTLSLLTGLDYHLTSIEQDYPMKGSLTFEPVEMTRLYELGYCVGKTGRGWRSTPPGYEPSEQLVPRAGTQFLVVPR